MSHLAPLPPLCGAFCIGCEICCDLVDGLDPAIKSEKTSKQFPGEEKTEQSLTPPEKSNAQLSHDIDRYHGQTRGKCSEKTGCRKNVMCDCNNIYHHRTACTCSRKRDVHEARCKSEKLHYIALCCIGKLACCRRSISPRGRGECRCVTKRCW